MSDSKQRLIDELAVCRFAEAMKEKLSKARGKGRDGWHDENLCSAEFLADMLVVHVGKGNAGNFEDIANLAMMLHQRGEDSSVLADSLARRDLLKQRLVDELAAHVHMIEAHAKRCGMDDPEHSILAMILDRGPEVSTARLKARWKAEVLEDLANIWETDRVDDDDDGGVSVMIHTGWLRERASIYHRLAEEGE